MQVLFGLSFILLLIILIYINNSGIGYKESSDYSTLSKKAELIGAETFQHISGNSKAILFIHGFPGSPKMYYKVRELAINSGYDVFVPKLPGFGTNHKEFLSSNFSMWYSFILDFYNNKRELYDKFYIVGNSMGGALTLKIAQNAVVKPTAIAAVAAPVFINSLKRGVYSSALIYFVRYIKSFKAYLAPNKPEKRKEDDQDGETEWVGYQGTFTKQIYSLILGLKGIKKDLSKIDIPCYLCHARKDRTVPFKNLEYISKHVTSKNLLIRVMDLSKWKHSNHSMFIYNSSYKLVWSDIDNFFNHL